MARVQIDDPRLLQHWHDQDDFFWKMREWEARIGVQASVVKWEPGRKSWATTNLGYPQTITFDSALLKMPRYLGEVVIVHELCHVLTPGARHGRLWKLFMSAYLPDWKEREAELQKHANGRKEVTQ